MSSNMTVYEERAWVEMAQDGTLRAYISRDEVPVPHPNYYSYLRKRTLEVMRRDCK